LSNKDLYIAQLQSYINKMLTKYSAIFDAIGMDDYDLVHECLEQKSELDAINSEGYSPLTYAAHVANRPFVRLFLSRGMSVDGRDAQKRTALMVACRNHDVDLVRLLLERGASVSVGDLIKALFERDDVIPSDTERILDILLQHGFSYEKKDLFRAMVRRRMSLSTILKYVGPANTMAEWVYPLDKEMRILFSYGDREQFFSIFESFSR
jgi:hypothetical protein